MDEITALTQERFRRMRPFGGHRPPPVDTSQLPPGPRWPAFAQSAGLLRFRHRFVPWAHRTYGDVFTIRVIPRGRPLVVFTRPEHAREIFAGDPEVFHAGKGNAILGPIMGEHSLLLLDGAGHKRARKLLMPAFSGQALRGYEDLVTGVAKTEVGSWQRDVPFRSLDRMNALTLEVILRVVFGVTDEERLRQLRPLVNRTVDVSPAVLLGWGWPALQRVGVWKRTVETAYALDRLIYAEIAERRRAPDLADRTDVLSQLIRVDDGGDRLTDPELRDQLVTLLLAGHETTATALAWALYEVGRDPRQRERARTAARTGDEAWLEAVVKESMRLHPVIPMVVRTLVRPATLAGMDLPAGVTVATSILIAHSRPDNHPDPEVFRPERFLGQSPPANTWIPFGGGVRRCIGASFSLMEAVAVLREVFTAYDVTAAGHDEPKVRNITSVPRRGARILVSA
ncbi:MAG TPA: cytochrome P450 [Nocardioides sp.]|uniref:cytochrome P450 n=1 Tax=Nocardioides sp. TaxID=35761 RepID=UPI002B57720D|nr:cytochrome P450 [Nocardioides sp.]HQR28595.1 cytochrome P450 [Nocardioides sp.]